MALHTPTDLPILADWLKILAEPRRLAIVNLLMAGVHCNCELGEHLQMTPNLISHHMRILRQAGLIEMERDAIDGRWVYYSINEDVLRELNALFSGFFNPQRIQPRHPSCGPQGAILRLADIPTTA